MTTTTTTSATWIWKNLSKQMAFCKVKRNEILDFCQKTSIKTLYFSISSDGSLLDEMTKKIKDTIIDVHSRGIKIHALVGDNTLCKTENHYKLLNIINKILQFDFDGFNLDVEPYVLKDENGKSLMEDPTQEIHKQFLEMMKKAYNLIKSSQKRIRFGICVPSWYDTSTTKYCKSLTWNGITKSLCEHLIDQSDYISIMAYTDSPDITISVTKFELEKGKKVVIGLNLNTSDGSPSYYDPNDPAAGVKRMEEDMIYIQAKSIIYPSYESMAVHHLELYMNYRGD